MKRLLILLFVLISLGSFGQGRIVVKVPSVTIPSSLPSQTGNAGKVLGTDGSAASWKQTTGYYYPEDYGAVGNGTTNDAAAFQSAINAMPARGGVLYLSNKTYLLNTRVTVNKPVTILGQGTDNNYTNDPAYSNPITALVTTSDTLSMLVLAAGNCSVERVAFKNDATATPTAGAAILVTSGVSGTLSMYPSNFRLKDITVEGFYDNIHVKNAYQWTIHGAMLHAAVRASLYIDDESIPDAGDQVLSDSWIEAMGRNTQYGIYHANGGGLKMTNVKFNSSPSSLTRLQYCYYGSVDGSSILLVSNCSFENYSAQAIHLENTSFLMASITNNQFAPYGETTQTGAIGVEATDAVNITGNIFRGCVAVVLNNSNNCVVGPNIYYEKQENPVRVSGGSGNDIYRPLGALNAFASTINTFYPSHGRNGSLTLTAPSTITFSGLVEGDEGVLTITQDGTGGHTLALAGATLKYYKSDGTSDDAISAAANAVSKIHYRYTNSELWIQVFKAGNATDNAAPTVASIGTVSSSEVEVVFSEAVTVTTAGWSFTRDGVANTINSVAGAGTTWTFTLATAMSAGEALTYSYSPASGATVDGAGNELSAVSGATVDNNLTGGGGIAATFIAAVEGAGTPLSTTQESALQRLVEDLSGVVNGEYTTVDLIGAGKVLAYWPMVGGSEAAHKFNLLDPQNTDAAFRLTFAGGPGHDAGGVTWNGVASANTHYTIPSGLQNDFTMVYYGHSSPGNGMAIGATDGTHKAYLLPYHSTGVSITALNDGTDRNEAVADGYGVWVLTRTAAAVRKLWRSNTLVYADTQASTGTPGVPLFLGARNNNGTGDLTQPPKCGGGGCSRG
jgi:hypothetical protein